MLELEHWGVLPKSKMRPVLVVKTDILFQQPSQVPLIENDHVIEQVPPHTANPSLRNSILPRTAEGSAHRLSLPETRFLLSRLHLARDISRLLGNAPAPGSPAHFLP